MSPSPPDEILVVDDNPNNLHSIEALLDGTGARIVRAGSGDEALRHLLLREFALIILDVQMPGLDGYDTAALIRARKRSRHIPIIFLTAVHRNEDAVAKGYSLGAVDFLFKPIVAEVLRAKVSVFLELSRQAREVERQAALLRDAERKDHERRLEEARRAYEHELLEQDMARERKLAEQMAARAAELARVVAEREQAEAALKRSNERLVMLSETAHRLLVGEGDESHFPAVCDRLSAMLGLEARAEFRVVEGTDGLRLTGFAGVPDDLAARLHDVAFARTIPGVVAASRRPVFVPCVADSPYADDEIAREAGLVTIVCHPLVAQDRLLGCLALGSRARRELGPDELDLIKGVCDQLAAALDRARLVHELQERDRRKDEFLAMLSHELRNPLAPICTAIDLMRSGDVPEPILRRATDTAERQIQHMTRLLNDLLDVSRITKGKVELRPAEVELQALVEEAVRTNERLVAQKQHDLVVRLPDEPIRLRVDPTRMTQVLANLVHNAAKYTEPRGRIEVEAEVQGGDVLVRVKDDGVGIEPAVLPHIFDVFVQAEPTSERAQGGLGLGLTLVKKLVELHGGSVAARSGGRRRGSEFVVRLPLPDVPAQVPLATVVAARGAEREALSSLPQMRILLVDDSDDIRAMMRSLLELSGHEVVEAADGATALELLIAQRPDLALVDIGLPVLDGYTVAARAREALNGAAPRLVALTGYGRAEERQRALDCGFDAHLVKPVSAAELSAVLRRLTAGPESNEPRTGASP